MIQFSLQQNIIAAIGQIDLIVVGLAILILFIISYIFGREEKDTNDFFLGSRKVPSIIACCLLLQLR
jgi:Na+/proline symporter